MISIFVSTDFQKHIQSLLNAEYRLNELVTISPNSDEADIILNAEFLFINPDWKNIQPPILFNPIKYEENILMGLIYARLSNYEKAYPLLTMHPAILSKVELLNRLQNGFEIEMVDETHENYIEYHNKAIAMHYGNLATDVDFNHIRKTYEQAIELSKSEQLKSFTTLHYAQLLNDAGYLNEAELIIQNALINKLSHQSIITLKNVLCNLWMKKLTIPYNALLMDTLKSTLWVCLEYYEKNHFTTEAGLVLQDAAHVATITNSFSEALGYINKSIEYFEDRQLTELIADAQLAKGNVLQIWAQNGNPQFYRSALQSYQQALNIFSKETAPDTFAEIHHQLGKVYAEIPDEVKRKSVWAAVSVSSFNEALSYFTKTEFPYEYAMICNNLGNAYTKYPTSQRMDNFEMALAWYKEALEIRTAKDYPIERVLTLANYLETSWFAGNQQEFDESRFNDMVSKAHEIITLSKNDEIIVSAKEDLQKLILFKQEQILLKQEGMFQVVENV